MDGLALWSHGLNLSARWSQWTTLRSGHHASNTCRVCITNGVCISCETTPDVIYSFVSWNVLVWFPNWCSPWSVRTHVHPNSINDVMITSKTGLLRIGWLCDHWTLSSLGVLSVLHHGPKLFKLVLKLGMVLIILNFICKRLWKNLNKSGFKASKLVSIKFPF